MPDEPIKFEPGAIIYGLPDRLFGFVCSRADKEVQGWSQHVLAQSMEQALGEALATKPYTVGDTIIIVELPHTVAGRKTDA